MTNTLEQITNGLNDAQKKAVSNPIETCTKIVAGAGTGKTKIISKRFLKLVLDLIEREEKDPESKILVITFTDKAANEMKSRIVQELEDFGLNISGFSDLWISTFHGFCIKILKKYAIEAGLSPSFKMAEEKQLKEIYDNLIKCIKYDEVHTIENISKTFENMGLDKDLLSLKNLSKMTSVNDFDSFFEDIYETIKKIKSLGVSPKEFLQKTLQATTNFSQTVKTTPFKYEAKEDYALAWAKHYSAYTDDYCLADENIFDAIAKEKTILDKNGKRKAIEYGMAQGFPENIVPIEKMELLVTKIIAIIFELYQKELEKKDIVDFDDLINKTIQIFKENEQIRSYYQNYFKQIIVDEFQDTNGAQLELIELLLNPQHANLTFVGDRKQSIYGFRYAQMENLEVLYKNVEKRYSQKYEPINLSINYRSTPEVLHAVNYVTENELKLEGENLWANPNITYPDTSEDIKVTVINEFENAYEQKIKEAEYIAKEIDNLIKRDQAKFKDFAVLVKSHAQADLIERELKKKNIPSVKKVNTGFFSEPVIKNAIATLRLVQNSEDEQAFFRILKTKFSDAEIFSFKKFLDKTLLENMEFDELKRYNLAQKFILCQNQNTSTSSKIENYASSVFETITYLRKNKHNMPIMQIFEMLKSKIQILPNKQKDFDAEQAQNNLKIFEKIIDDYTQNENYLSINNLIDYIEKIANDRNFELPSIVMDDVNAVQLLTIHASKGLEFPYTFILSISSSAKMADKSSIIFDMQYGDKPGFGIILKKFNGKPNPKVAIYKNYWQKPREENEAKRLFYVAVSRAKKYLNTLSFEAYSTTKPVDYIENLREYLN